MDHSPDAPIDTKLYEAKFLAELKRSMNHCDGEFRHGEATWLGKDRFEVHGTFTLLELCCIYVTARNVYPAGTVEERKGRGELPPGW